MPSLNRFKRVNHRFQVPLNALILQSVIPTILGLIYLGSETIFFAFFQLTTIGYLVSYFIPILLVFLRRDLLPPAYWRMPDKLAKFCNIVALLYVS
jgi:amino acid transporter